MCSLKNCSICKEDKALIDFPKYGGNRCKVCKNAIARTVYNSDLEKNRAQKCIDAKRVYSTEKRRNKARVWRAKHPDKVAAANKKYYHHQVNWRKKHPEVYAFHSAKRRAAQLQATPPWVLNDPEHLKQIADLYQHAKMMQEFKCQYFHVDHIEPLKGKTSCGLHVVWNLAIIPAEENIKKNNKLIVQQT